MANAALERFVLTLSAPVFLTAFVLVLIFLSHSLTVVLFTVFGYVLGIVLFEATAAVYGAMGEHPKVPQAFAVGFLVLTFALLVLVIWFTVRTDMTVFWGFFAGLMAVPAAIIVYIILEASGLTHTGFFT